MILSLLCGNSAKLTAQTGCDPEWEQLLFYSYIGSIGMESADYDNDGMTELIMANRQYWCVMEYNPEQNDYEVVWKSKLYFGYYIGYIGELCRIKIMDADNDGEPELLAGTQRGVLEIYDLKTLTLENTIIVDFQLAPVAILLKDDCDNDGKDELIVGTDYDVIIYNIIDGQFILQQSLEFVGQGVACGDTDGDGINSLVFPNGTMITIQNGVVSEPIVYCSSCADEFVELLDVDSDGKDEIIHAAYTLKVIDADIAEVKWQRPTEGCNILYLKDINGDNKKEILYGEGNWGSLNCIEPTTGSLMWEIPNDEGFGQVLITDSDNDGEEEVIISSNFNEEEGFLQIFDLSTRIREWINHPVYGPVCGIGVDDVDGDGQPEIVTLSKSGDLFFYNAQTREAEWQSAPGQLPCIFYDLPLMKIYDVDNDGFKEIIITAGSYSEPSIVVFNGASKTVESQYKWHYSSNLNPFRSMDIADTDNNGTNEYICSTASFVYIISSSDYSIRRSPELFRIYESIAADIDNDNQMEIISASDRFTILDALTFAKELEFDPPVPWQTFTALHAKDFDLDGKKEIICGSNEGMIMIFDGTTNDTTWINTGTDELIYTIRGGDFTDLPGNEFVFTSNDNHLNFYNSNLPLVTREAYFKYIHRALDVTDYNNDGKAEIFMGTMVNAVEYSPDCFVCASFTAGTQIISADIKGTATCEGKVSVNLAGGTQPYRYKIGNNTFTLQNNEISGLCAGSHTITFLDAANCDITVDIFIEEVLGLPELTPGKDFTVYPVPTTGLLNVQYNALLPSGTLAEIRSMQGVLMMSIPLSQPRSAIDVSSLSRGVYVMIISNGNRYGIVKIVIA